MSLALSLDLPTKALLSDLSWCLSQAKPSVVRPISQWVEEELVLPTGPFAGERYKHSRHPVSAPWFGALDSGNWSRCAATGPQQNGKSVMCFSSPLLYHLFEMQETVVVGIPSMKLANDKWSQDFKPLIEASNYRDLMPLRGEGSKGGTVKSSVTFRNGATLRFMSGGGDDKTRSSFTTRVVAITETDGMDSPGETSREADKIEQIEGRTRAFGRTGRRIYLECTVSIEEGRIWQELKNGTDSRLVRPCPHCKEWVSPEREHLVGWQDAESEDEAAELAHWVCPACGEEWTQADRETAAKRIQIIHRGQEVTPAGKVVGPLPKTKTLGFRWSAIDNPFTTAADIGAEEWRAARAPNRENSEKKLRQWVWCLPYESPDIDLTPLDAETVRNRRATLKRGVVPANCLGVAVGVDTNKRHLHWEAKAIAPDGRIHVIEYGEQKVDSKGLGILKGLLQAFRTLYAYFEAGWQTEDNKTIRPSQVWIDSGWFEHTDAVYALCAEANKGLPPGSERYRPTKGYGENQQKIGPYRAPTGKAEDVKYLGREYHISEVRRKKKKLAGILLVHMNADYWKSEFHQRLSMGAEEPGAIVLFDSPQPMEHDKYSRHITAEKQIEKFITGRGSVITWQRTERDNHFLDAGYSATAACDFILAMRAKKKADGEKPAGGWFASQKQKRRAA